jgi:hypothetical protein
MALCASYRSIRIVINGAHGTQDTIMGRDVAVIDAGLVAFTRCIYLAKELHPAALG